jgi:hypothetical protein
MEPKLVELRERGRRQVRRAAIILGAGAAIGVLLIGGFVVYRLTRPATPRERLRRLAPSGISLARARRSGRRLRKRVLPLRLSIGEQPETESRPPEPTWMRLVMPAARMVGTAAATALTRRLIASLGEGSAQRSEKAAERK